MAKLRRHALGNADESRRQADRIDHDQERHQRRDGEIEKHSRVPRSEAESLFCKRCFGEPVERTAPTEAPACYGDWTGSTPAPVEGIRPLRHAPGGAPTYFLKLRLKAASDSKPTSAATCPMLIPGTSKR